MSKHRIEFMTKAPNGQLDTLSFTVESARATPRGLALLARQFRGVLQACITTPIEHARDFPIPDESVEPQTPEVK
jgi:hypothetical protein